MGVESGMQSRHLQYRSEFAQAGEQGEPAMNESVNGTVTDQPQAQQALRVNVLGVGISVINMETAIALSDSFIQSNGRGYVCVTGVHGVMVAQQDHAFRQILNDSVMSTPDGMPMVWMGKLRGHASMAQVFGPGYMLGMCQRSVERGYRHFLYGGNEGVAEQLAAELRSKVPGLQIVGTYTPPFRPLNPSEEAELAAMVAETKPDIFWVGLSTPKQERFMAAHLGKLDVKLMVGVGAAFDFHTGRIKDSPRWLKNLGLQWLHRTLQEPRRLVPRYAKIVPAFLFLATLQILGIRKYGLNH
jgi:N-acetylglucosaminyldiphosphoundecaprenol N-acetyl-beta-D-mannosaminyltransferase